MNRTTQGTQEFRTGPGLSRAAWRRGLFLLQGAGAGEDAGQRVVALVARGLEDLVLLLIAPHQRNLERPWGGERGRVLDGDPIHERVCGGPGEPLDQMQVLPRTLVARLVREVGRIDDQR